MLNLCLPSATRTQTKQEKVLQSPGLIKAQALTIFQGKQVGLVTILYVTGTHEKSGLLEKGVFKVHYLQ